KIHDGTCRIAGDAGRGMRKTDRERSCLGRRSGAKQVLEKSRVLGAQAQMRAEFPQRFPSLVFSKCRVEVVLGDDAIQVVGCEDALRDDPYPLLGIVGYRGTNHMLGHPGMLGEQNSGGLVEGGSSK